MIADQNRKTIRHRWTQMSAGWNWGIKKIAVIARQRRHRTSSENHNQRQNPTLVM
jgi:hypothetical protein